MNLKYIVFFATLIFSINFAFCMGNKEDPIHEADSLISKNQYNEALAALTDILKNNPDRFDDVQKRITSIMQARAKYNEKAQELLNLVIVESDDEEQKLKIISELETLDAYPESYIYDFILNVKDYALFTSKKNRFDIIMRRGVDFIANGKFLNAITVYESGLDIYKEEFINGKVDLETKQKIIGLNDSAIASIKNFYKIYPFFLESTIALSEACQNLNTELVEKFIGNIELLASDFAKQAKLVKDIGENISHIYGSIKNNYPRTSDVAFLAFAYRLILGRSGELSPDGISGSMYLAWEYMLNIAELSLNNMVLESLSQAKAYYDNGNWFDSKKNISIAKEASVQGLKLMALWSLYFNENKNDLKEFGKYAVKTHGQHYLSFLRYLEILNNYESLIDIQSVTLPKILTLTDSDKNKNNNAFYDLFKSVDTVAKSNTKISSDIEKAILADYDMDWASAEQKDVEKRLNTLSKQSQTIETQIVLSECLMKYNKLAETESKIKATFNEGLSMMRGIPSDNPAMPNTFFYYPTKAYKLFESIKTPLKNINTEADDFISFVQGLPPYIKNEAQELLEKTQILAKQIQATIDDNNSLLKKSAERKQSAVSNRLEAEHSISEALAALKSTNYVLARDRLEKARDRFFSSLQYEYDAELQKESDKILADIAARIIKAENDIVVAETRQLVTQGKNYYMKADFNRAEAVLLQARTRWAMTNANPEFEVEYWLKLVQAALTVKTGRSIPVTAPLFPEMSQLLSLAKRYYDEGVRYISEKDKANAEKSFRAAKQKIAEVKVVFPLNQEARVLELRIDQVSNPSTFADSFARMFAEAKSRIDTNRDITIAYSDLHDLAAVNPNYPGLKPLIEKTEIILGIRQPPPDMKAINESKALVAAAKKIFESGQISQFEFARAQLDKALGYDPNNEEASALKDKIATYIGGTTSIVLSSNAEALYSEAATFFTSADYISARAKLNNLISVYPKSRSVQKVIDLDARLKARGY